MASTIKLKNGSGAPLASDLVAGEPALDLTNKRLYTEDSGGTVIEVGTNPTELQVDNINIDGNAITSTDTDGNIAITPNGTGEVDISKVDIDSGAIDGTVIGGTTTAAGSFTTLQADTSLNVDGTVTADGLTVASAENNSVSIESSDAFANLRFKDNLGSARIVTTNGSLLIQSGGDTSYTGLTGRLNIATNGDISFYEDTGTTAKFFWDASAEQLQLTTQNTEALDITSTTGAAEIRMGGLNSNFDIRFGAASNASLLPGEFFVETNGTERLRIDSSGNVGIGTTSPSTNLEISDDDVELRLTDTSGGYSDIRYAAGVLQIRADQGNNVGSSSMRFSVDSSEAMRIDSSGNVGINETLPTAPLQIKNTSAGAPTVGLFLTNSNVTADTEVRLAFAAHTNTDIATDRYSYISAINTSGSNGQALRFATNETGASAVERMRIDSSGRVNMYNAASVVSNNTGRLADARNYIRFTDTDTSSVAGQPVGEIQFYNSDSNGAGVNALIRGVSQFTSGITGIEFHTGGSNSPAKRMEINWDGSCRWTPDGTNADMTLDASGNLLVGATSNTGSGATSGTAVIQFNGAVANGIYVDDTRTASGTDNALVFGRGATFVGKISTTTSSTSYVTSSDYRLKENVVDMTGAVDRVKALNPSQFNFIADPDTTVDGFLAHEVSDVVPEAVTGTKDAMTTEEYEVTPAVLDDDGNVVTEAVMGTREVPDYQGIDQSKLVPLLTGALQEAIARIETLEAQVATLQGN